MKNIFKMMFSVVLVSTFALADILITEIADPNNNASARFVELHNNGTADVDLSQLKIRRYTNGSTSFTGSSNVFLSIESSMLAPGAFFIICKSINEFETVYGGTCNLQLSSGVGDSNGDDQFELTDADGNVLDAFGVIGDDPNGGSNDPGSHEFEDGRAERAADCITAQSVYTDACWNTWSDGPGGDVQTAQNAPDDYDSGSWIGTSTGGGTCDDATACNNGEEGFCEYPATNYDCDDNFVVHAGSYYFTPADFNISVGETVLWVNDGGMHDANGDINTQTGESFNNPEVFDTDATNDAVIGSHTFNVAGVYNYDCSVGSHAANGMVGSLTVGIGGCIDNSASNYSSDADYDNGSCVYPDPDALNLFISEYIEGSSNNKAIEIYNPSDHSIALDGIEIWRISNGGDWVEGASNAVSLAGLSLASDDVLVICNSSVWNGGDNPDFTTECDFVGGDLNSATYFNGDDAMGLAAYGTLIDAVGEMGADPGSGWDVAGVTNGTANHTIVRKSDIVTGNTDWSASSGTNADNSEWVVLDQNEWSYLGSHPHEFVANPDVYIVGDMNGWQPGSEGWGIVTDNNVGHLTSSLTAGSYGYKAVEGSSWDDSNYPGDNQSVSLTEDGDVTFYVNVNSDLVFHTNPSVVGSFFSAMDGSGDWDPANSSGEMIATQNDYEWSWSGVIPNGDWEFKVALNQNFNQNTGDNLSITSDGVSATTISYGFATNNTSYTIDAPTYDVTFNVDMNFQIDDEGNISIHSDGLLLRGSWQDFDGDGDGFDWEGAQVMNDDDSDGVYSVVAQLTTGTHTFKYDNGPWETVPEGCGTINQYQNYDRSVTVNDAGLVIDTVCWGACEACLGGCMDPYATNYDTNANTDDGSCNYNIDPPDNLVAYLNEIHYDNTGSDVDEGVEVVATSGMSLEQLGMIVLTKYNGGGGVSYGTYTLNDFTEGETVDGLTYYSITFPVNGLQNGAPDGVALSGFDNVFQFLSYEGTFDATDGVAIGLTSTDIGTQESSSTEVGTSIQFYGDSGWLSGVVASLGMVNPSVCSDGTACNFGQAGDCTFADTGFDCDGNAVIDVTFSVNMADQEVHSDGIKLYLGGFHDLSDDDGDNIYSTTLSLVASTEYSYKFNNGGCYDAGCFEANFNDLGCGDGSSYGNRSVTTSNENMDVGPFCFGSCTDCEAEVVCGTGDVNDDGVTNVVDIVNIVSSVLGTTIFDDAEICAADANLDGIVNVVDIVNIVYNILNSGMDNNSFADNIMVHKNEDGLSIYAQGIVGGIQLTISHENDAKIKLTDNSYLSKFRTVGNHTTIILVSPEIGQIVDIDSEFEILDMIASDLEGEIDVNIIDEFNLLMNYPNPFNPVTTITYTNEIAGNVDVKIYDLNGRLINTLISQQMEVGQYNIDWNGIDNNGFDVTSGIYLLTLENESGITTSKITLLR